MESYINTNDLKSIVDEDYNISKLNFASIDKALKKQLHQLERKGSDLIPVTSYEKIILNGGKLPENIARKLIKRGVLVIRNTLSLEMSRDWISNILKYLYDNNAFPKRNQVHGKI